MKIERAHPGQTINLGRMGEHNVRQVVFDLSEWMEQYGPGRAEILYQRSGDERPYLRPATQVQDTLVWTIDSWDTEYSKSGKCELRWYNAETDSLAKSKSWSTTVGASLGVPSTEAPHEPELGWVEEVLSAGAQAQYASQVARISEHNAEVWVEGGILLDEYGKPVAEEVAGVKGYATAAEESKDAAAYSAKKAALYQTVVYQNAQRAESAANRAESAAAIAEPAAERAEAARNSIVLDEEKMAEARYVAEYSAKVAKDGQTKGFTASATLSGGASKTSIGTLELGRPYYLSARSTNGSVARGERFVYTGKPFSFSASASDGMESYVFEAEVSCSGNIVTLTNKGGRAVIEVRPADATQFEAPKTSAERAQESASAASSYAGQASSSASSAQESASSAFNDSVNAQNNAGRAEEAYRSAQRSAERAEAAVSDAAQYSRRAEAAADRAEAAGSGSPDAVLYTPQTLTESQKAQARENIGAAAMPEAIEPATDDIPKVFIDGTIPTTKDDVLAEMQYTSKTNNFHAYLKIKCQGSSSMSYPKKNFTVNLYADEAREVELPMSFKDWGFEANKFVLKANYIDHSHARNIVSARLWSEVVASRFNYNSLPSELRNSPNNGAVDGFPVKVYTNGTYQGIYTWNIGKDAWLWGMDENNANHVLLCGKTNDNGTLTEKASSFRALWNGADGTYWDVEVGENSEAVKNSLNALISCVMNTTDDEFKAQIGNYLDVQSAIDYFLFSYAVCGLDNLGQNMLLATYDGKKWICGQYDLDSTFGLWWNGQSFVPSTYACPDEYQEAHSLLWERIEVLYMDELKARYAELRASVLGFPNMVTHFERFMDVISSDLYAEDLTVYTSIPSGDTNNIKQIRDFIRDRLVYVDGRFGMGAMYPLVNGTKVFDSGATITVTNGNHVRITVPDGKATDGDFYCISDISKNSGATAAMGNAPSSPVLFTIPSGATVEFKKHNTIVHSGAENMKAGSVYIKPDVSFGDLHAGKLDIDSERTFTTSSAQDVASIGVYSKATYGTSFDVEFDISLIVDGVQYV